MDFSVYLFNLILQSSQIIQEVITMKFPTKYTLALQILCICYLYNDQKIKITSNFIAEHTGADPSIIRYTMLDLKKKNYISSKPGPGGTTLSCDLSQISLFDVFELVSDKNESELKFYDLPANATSIDSSINDATDYIFKQIQEDVFQAMKKRKVIEICNSAKL